MARHVARRLDFLELDTGGMYRAVALGLLRQGGRFSEGDREVPPESLLRDVPEAELETALDAVRVTLSPSGAILLDGEEVADELRTPRITRWVSPLSALPAVRHRMVAAQRAVRQRIAERPRGSSPRGLVAEGRDMGTVVFPDAILKVFLDASLEERARRRSLDYAANGVDLTPARVQVEIEERDARDREREHAPLRPADDAVVLDSTTLTLESVVARIVTLYLARVGELA